MDGDAAFRGLDFRAIYHDDYVTDDNREYIHDCRMAEVMVPRRLPLDGVLKAIMFRSVYDRYTFDYLINCAKIQHEYPLGVEKVSGSLFMHFGMYIREMNYAQDRLVVKFKYPRNPPNDNKYKINIRQIIEGDLGRHYKDTRTLDSSGLAISEFEIDSHATWKIELEDVLAFEGQLAHRTSEVFG